MKKKIIAIVIGTMIVSLVGGCGQSDSGKAASATPTATAEVLEKAVEEAEDEAEEVTKIEEPDVVVEPEQTAEPDESDEAESVSCNSVEGEEDEYVGELVDGWIKVGEYAESQDNVDSYNINSEFCSDVDQFLDENGCKTWGYEDKEMEEYSGRWAYPKFQQNELFDEVWLFSRSDDSEMLDCFNNTTGMSATIYIYTGMDYYNNLKDFVGVEFEDPSFPETELMFTTHTSFGETDVLHEYHETTSQAKSYDRDEDGNIIEGSEKVEDFVVKSHSYMFNIGNFSVMVISHGEVGYAEEEVQKLIDSFVYVTGDADEVSDTVDSAPGE